MDLGTFAFHLGCVCAGYVFAVSLEWFVHNIFFHRMGKKKGHRSSSGGESDSDEGEARSHSG